jgi:hypothetical protein
VNSELESSATTSGTWAPLVLARTLRASKTAVELRLLTAPAARTTDLAVKLFCRTWYQQAFFMGGRRGVGRHGRGAVLLA